MIRCLSKSFILYSVVLFKLTNISPIYGTIVSKICPIGSYFSKDFSSCLLCPGGTFGSRSGLVNSNCTAQCHKGFYCPPGSRISRERQCGSPSFYCPEGSASPLPVSNGYYTTTTSYSEEEGLDSIASSKARKQSEQFECEMGHYCVYGIRRQCPAGTYGNDTGLTDRFCSGVCPFGHFCPSGTANPIPCPAGRYGNSSGLTSSLCSGLCPIAHFCEEGQIIPIPCPSGRFGGEEGLKNKMCLDECPKGFFCLLGNPEPQECGDSSVYCPSGSGSPTISEEGYYTVSTLGFLPPDYVKGARLEKNDKSTRIAQIICEKGHYCIDGVKYKCPAGQFGNMEGLSSNTCSGACPKGYYCPIGTSSFEQFPCGSVNVFCPLGSKAPNPVQSGYYTSDGPTHRRESETICPMGSYCINGMRHLCPAGRYGSHTMLSTSECSSQCSNGYICDVGSVSSTPAMCPAGFYSQNGRKCMKCARGYYCKAGSPTSTQIKCGIDAQFCPRGSDSPTDVHDGFYSYGANANTRFGETSCTSVDHPSLPKCPSTTQGRDIHDQ